MPFRETFQPWMRIGSLEPAQQQSKFKLLDTNECNGE